MTSFGDRVSTEVIVKMKSLGWVLIQCDWFPYRKRAFGHKDRHMETHGDAGRRQATCKPRRETWRSLHPKPSGASSPDYTLTVNFSPPELRHAFPPSEPPRCVLVTAALAD